MHTFLVFTILTTLLTDIQCDDFWIEDVDTPFCGEGYDQNNQHEIPEVNVEKTVISNIIEDAGRSYLDVIINADHYVVKVLIFETISHQLSETIGRVLVKYELSRLYDYTPEVRCLLLVHKKGEEKDIDLFTLYSGDEQLLIINGRKSVVGEAISAILSYRATKK